MIDATSTALPTTREELIAYTTEELTTLYILITAEIEARSLPVAAEPTTPAEPIEYATVKSRCCDQSDITWETHARGKNWMATVTSNKQSPGGLDRSFWTKGSTCWRIVPTGLQVGDVVEVAAEYISGSGKNDHHRKYIVIVSIEDDRLGFRYVQKPD